MLWGEVVIPARALGAAGDIARVLGGVGLGGGRATLHLEQQQHEQEYTPLYTTLVSCGLGGPCILQLYMAWAAWAGYAPATPAGTLPGLSAREEAPTGSCQLPPPGSPPTPWPATPCT